MSLWGCQVGSQFLQCAGTYYTLPERLLVGGVLIATVSDDLRCARFADRWKDMPENTAKEAEG